jgi:quercetin dioxygenase-like cupin family protein
MRVKIVMIVSLACAALVGIASAVQATPALDATSLTIVRGTFAGIDTTNRTDIAPGPETRFWQARMRMKGATDVYVVQNTVAAGGTLGWHTHPGPSLIFVKSGTATEYRSDDPSCTPHVYQAGQSSIVDGGSDVHVIRNEGMEPLVTVVVAFVPAGMARRIDSPTAPANCPNLPNG